jgi:PAB-dependent poly(A)-specific ribonuclease subunit 3
MSEKEISPTPPGSQTHDGVGSESQETSYDAAGELQIQTEASEKWSSINFADVMEFPSLAVSVRAASLSKKAQKRLPIPHEFTSDTHAPSSPAADSNPSPTWSKTLFASHQKVTAPASDPLQEGWAGPPNPDAEDAAHVSISPHPSYSSAGKGHKAGLPLPALQDIVYAGTTRPTHSPVNEKGNGNDLGPENGNDVDVGGPACLSDATNEAAHAVTDMTMDTVADHPSSAKKLLNVESPSFTPAQLQPGAKKLQFSSQTPLFTPKTTVNCELASQRGRPFDPLLTPAASTSVLTQDAESAFPNPGAVRDFTPQSQNYELNTVGTSNGITPDPNDPFGVASMNQALPQPQYNMYADDHTTMAAAGTAFYQTQGAYTAPTQPLQYHLYAPSGTNKPDLAPYQRHASDFFLPNNIREDLQKKSEATRQVLANSQLPPVAHYHSLVPLDTSSASHSFFGSSVCWIYKATSKKNGHVYCLRRLQGARVNSKEMVGPLAKWKRINNGSIVSVHECFTSRDFNDNSLIFIHSYHPNSKTLAEFHFGATPGSRFGRTPIQETVLWSYICQICSALRDIHSENLAARCIDMTKIILTEKNRIRLGACFILDVLEYETPRPLVELQQEDFVALGKLILCLGLNLPNITNSNIPAALEQFSKMIYSAELKEVLFWLSTMPQTPEEAAHKSVHELTRLVAGHMADSLNSSLQAYDEINSQLHKELENGRIARLLLKLGTINERPEYDNDPLWSENGERYQLKLFRDYVFHQVDMNGSPVLDLAHMISCLNKLDAGIDERVQLTSRDNQISFVVTYRELKKQVANAFSDLNKPGQNKQAAQRGY